VSYESFRFAGPKDPAEAIPLDDGDICIYVQCPMFYAPEQGLQPHHSVRPPKILCMRLSRSFFLPYFVISFVACDYYAPDSNSSQLAGGRDRHRSQDGGSNKVGVEGAEEDNDMLTDFVVTMEVEMTDGGQESGVAEDQEGDSTAWKDMTPHH
jgi:hypothetical protein